MQISRKPADSTTGSRSTRQNEHPAARRAAAKNGGLGRRLDQSTGASGLPISPLDLQRVVARADFDPRRTPHPRELAEQRLDAQPIQIEKSPQPADKPLIGALRTYRREQPMAQPGAIHH